MKTIRSTMKHALITAGISAALVIPAQTAMAGEGPFERGGKNVFELQRDKRNKTVVKVQRDERKQTEQVAPSPLKQAVDKAQKKDGWARRIFKPYRSAGHS